VAIAPAAASRCCCASRRWTTATAPARRGAQAILLGCTEIDLLVGPGDAAVPVFARLDADNAVELALEPLRAL
jgi:aspartate/glutamate racemase